MGFKMNTYIGTKTIRAIPMTKGAYNLLRGWEMSRNEDAAEAGYLVEYTDGGKPNVEGFKGYVSWSPKDVFEKSYRQITSLTFGVAVEALKKGLKVARQGWNGKGMFLFLVPGSNFIVNREPLLGIYPEGTNVKYLPHIDMRTAGGEIVPWLASQTDVLGEDWVIVD